MSRTLFIAQRLGLSSDGRSSPLLRIAVVGIALAMVIMILSFAIVTGFRNSITDRIYALDAHIRIAMYQSPDSLRPQPLDSAQLSQLIDLSRYGTRTFAVTSRACVVKTDNDFKGLTLLGIAGDYPIDFISRSVTEGALPDFSADSTANHIAISGATASQLGVKCGDRIYAYFVEDALRARRLTIKAIFDTDFDDYDDAVAIGSRAMLNDLSGFASSQCSYIGIDIADPSAAREVSNQLLIDLQQAIDAQKLDARYSVSNIIDNYASYFTWLDILDTNIVIILVLMAIVAGFALIAGLLIIILDHIPTIGMMKSVGATNALLRRVYMFLGLRLLAKAMLIGNLLGFGLALLQYFTHAVPLDADAYNMPFVPISFDWTWIVGLNIGVVLVAYIAMIIPAHAIARISPAETLRYE